MNKKASFIQDLLLPVVAAPMFLISSCKMVVECCKNGIVGTFPALNQPSSSGFEEWLFEIKEELTKFSEETGKKTAPFGVNLIVHHSNPRLETDLKLCIKYQVPLIITSMGSVSTLIEEVHNYGGLVFHDVITLRHAEKAAEAGVDGLILVTAGAGGHGGTINPMSFIAEINHFFDKTILLAGCISTGRDIASSMQMGADLAYMGTRFINTLESHANDEYRQMIINSNINDIIYTAAVSGVNANFLRSSLEAMGITEQIWNNKVRINLGEELNTEAKAWKNILSAGHGVAAIKDILSVKDLIIRLKTEFKETVKKQYELLKVYS